MDKKNLDAIINRYLQKFDLTNGKPHEEYFKWQAAACFQRHWNLDAENMLGMFAAATRDFGVLLDGSRSLPTEGINELLKKPYEAELVRSAFKTLLSDDGGNLRLRQNNVECFVDTINACVEHYWPGSHLYPQTMRSAIGYLAMAKPAENYIYFYSKAENWANCVEFGEDIGSGSDFSLAAYYRMCDELVQMIEDTPALRECSLRRLQAAIADNKNPSLTSSDFSFIDHYHILAYDIMYCATTYHLYVDIPHYSIGASKRIERAKERHELEMVKADYLTAQNRYDEIRATAYHPVDMVGLKVQHKVFGEGTIRSHADTKQEIDFSGTVKTFIYPDAYIQKFLTPISDNANNIIVANVLMKKELSSAMKELSEKRAIYEKKQAAFYKRWVKSSNAVKDADNEKL